MFLHSLREPKEVSFLASSNTIIIFKELYLEIFLVALDNVEARLGFYSFFFDFHACDTGQMDELRTKLRSLIRKYAMRQASIHRDPTFSKGGSYGFYLDRLE